MENKTIAENLYEYVTTSEFLDIKDKDKMENKLNSIYVTYRNQFPTYIYRNDTIERSIKKNKPPSFPNNFTDELRIGQDDVKLEYEEAKKEEKLKAIKEMNLSDIKGSISDLIQYY